MKNIYKSSSERDILRNLLFKKEFVQCKYQQSSPSPFYISEAKHGEIVMIEKVDGDIEFFPVVNNKIETISSEEWVRKLYKPFYTISGDTISVVPTHTCSLSKKLIINQVRGTATHVNQFGHFVLDELTFLTIFNHIITDSQALFVSRYSKQWQLSLISYFFSCHGGKLSNSYRTPDSLDLKPTGFESQGIIKKVVILYCQFQIVTILPPQKVTPDYSLVSRFADSYCKVYREALSEQITRFTQPWKVCLLSRRKNGNYLKRWHNSETILTKVASSLDQELSIIYPEDLDPISLILQLRSFKYIFSEPGSGIFLPLLLRNKDQIFIMPTSLANSNRKWEGMLIDFKAFSKNLHLLHGKVLDNSNINPGWNDPFMVYEKDITNFFIERR